MSSCGAGGLFVISVHCLLKSQRFGRDSRFMLSKFFGALAANLGSGSTDGGLSSIAVCSLHGCDGSNFHIVSFLLGGSTCGQFCGAGLVLCFWPSSAIRYGGRSPATAEAVSVCVGHGQNGSSGVRRRSGVFHQRLILRTASTAAMLNTTGRMYDTPNGLFWILTPDGDVYPELLRVPPVTGIIWLNERNELVPTTVMPGGRHLKQELRIRSSQAHFALSRSHRAGGSRSSTDGGHLQGG